MVEENKDLNNAQPVTEPDLSQPVTGTDLTTQSVTGEQVETLADGDEKDKKTVKYAEFEKKNAALKAAEEQVVLLQNQMALVQANQQAVQQPQQPASVYEQAKADLGLTDVEYIDEANRGKIYARINEITNQQNQQNAIVFANRQFEDSHPDFGSVVGVRNLLTQQIQPTAEILKILTEKPYLTAAAYASSQGAYEIVMAERKLNELAQQTIVQEEHLKQQGIDTKLAPVSGAAAVGGAIQASAGTVTLEQQQEMEQRVANGEFNQKG